MKRRFFTALCALLLLLAAGCKSQPQTLDLTGGMSCDVAIQYGDIEAAGRLERTAAGVCRLTVNQPEELSGMVFDWENGSLQISFKGLSYTMDSAALPQTAFASVLMRCLDAAAMQGGLLVKGRDGERLICAGQGEDGAFTLRYNESTRQIESLSIPAVNFEAVFVPGDEASSQ